MESNLPKILIFSLAYQPFVGGAEVAIKEITDRLGGEFDFDMITANLDGRKKEFEHLGNINVYRISLFPPPYEAGLPVGREGGWGEVKKLINKYLFPWLAYKKAVELHQQNNYQMIWAMMANQAGWAALKFKKKFPPVKYLLTLQEGDSEWDIFWRTFLIRLIYKAIYRRADYIQAISNFLKKRAENLGAQCPIGVVPNGVSIKNYELRIKNNDLKRVISVSRLVKKNGLEDLIKAMAIVNKNQDKPVVLKIIGEGNLRRKLDGLIKKNNINDRAIIKKYNKEEKVLEGQVSNKQDYEYLSQADIFIRPSLSEGLGNAFLEAMSVGVPVIATPVGGIPDFLRDRETGWFCKVKDPKSIAEKINYILNPANKDIVAGVVENARKMVQEKYNWDSIAVSMRNIFIDVIARERK